MNTLSTIKNLKSNGEDYEWYPTTQEIIEKTAFDIVTRQDGNSCGAYDRTVSILDIGAGDGRALEGITTSLKKQLEKEDDCRHRYKNSLFGSYVIDFKQFAIEKSKVLIEQLVQKSPDTFIIGSDFYQQTFVDKSFDIVFCNPPYSEYSQWVERILYEINTKYLYFVIPRRWKNNKAIQQLIDEMGLDYEVVDSFDFYDGDRKARAVVDLVHFDFKRQPDTFNKWIKSVFDIVDDDKIKKDLDDEREAFDEVKNNKISEGKNQINILVKLYNQHLDELKENYDAVMKLDRSILKTLGVSVDIVLNAFKERIVNLKKEYWLKLFENLNTITDKLTVKSRKEILDKLQGHTSVDFNEGNIYNIIIWTLKNANDYFDDQIVDMFQRLTSADSINVFKSNTKTFKQHEWRYNGCQYEKYSLDYRIIKSGYSGWNEYRKNGLSDHRRDFLNDILTIASTLGYKPITAVNEYVYEARTEYTFRSEFNGKEIDLFKVRMYQNGNSHLKFNQRFILKLNVECARILKWVSSPQEFFDETQENIDEKDKKQYIDDIAGMYDSSFRFMPSHVENLLEYSERIKT